MIQVNVLDQYTCAFKCVHVNFMYYMSLQWGVRSTNDLTKKVNILWIPLQKSQENYTSETRTTIPRLQLVHSGQELDFAQKVVYVVLFKKG